MSAIATLRRLALWVFVGCGAIPSGARAADPPPPKFAWTIKALPVVTRWAGEPIHVSILVGPVAATGVVVTQPMLVERNTRRPIAPKGLRACPSSAQDCGDQPLNLPANSAAEVWLWGAEGAGVFEGSVTLAAKEKPEGDTVLMNVNSSSGEDKAWGVAAIFASVALTWLLTVYLRNLGNRAHLLVPAAIALRTMAGIRIQAQAGPQQLAVPKLLRRLEDIEQQLALPALQANGLPPRVPWPGPAFGGAGIDALRKHVQAQNDLLHALNILVQEGLQPARDLWATIPEDDTDARRKVCEAVSAMDALSQAAVAPAPDALRVTLRSIAAGMAASAKGGSARSLRDHLADAADSVGTPEQLLVQVTALGGAGWVFLLLVTTLAGAYILVLGPAGAGFGTVTDYAQCLLWGAGLPAGAQLMQSTSASIATSFGVTR